MIDTDLLLLPAMSHYFLDLPQGQGRAEQFFAHNATLQNGTYAEILNRYEYTHPSRTHSRNALFGNIPTSLILLS